VSSYCDAIIFMERREAKVFHFSAINEIKLVVMHTSARRRHHQTDHEDRLTQAVDEDFLRRIVESLDHAGHTLICGPGNAKFELEIHLGRHRPDLAARICGVEALDDAGEGAILEMARHFFRMPNHRRAKEAGRLPPGCAEQ